MVAAVRVVKISSVGGSNVDSSTELDSHADTCVLGKHALIIHDFETLVCITGYDKLGGKVYKTVTGVLAYDDPQTGQAVMLIVHQGIHIPHLEHNLLCPMQTRVNDIRVEECPKSLTQNPDNNMHAITIPQNIGDELYVIPLSLKGITSYFPTHKPTLHEFESSDLRFELTYEVPEWDPQSVLYAEQEEQLLDPYGKVTDYVKPFRDP
jgi:hypothetical protein